MSLGLLDNIRKLGKLVSMSDTKKIMFDDICRCMGEALDSHCFILSKKGKLLGGFCSDSSEEISLFRKNLGDYIDTAVNNRFLDILSTFDNVNLQNLGIDTKEKPLKALISPIIVGGERLSTIILYRQNTSYEMDDIIMAEYAGTIIGLEILRSDNAINTEARRNRENVKKALSALSPTEITAIRSILRNLQDKEGILVASTVSSREGITRSIIANALKKLESARIIETHSGGMKGTHIKITNDYLLEEIEKAPK